MTITKTLQFWLVMLVLLAFAYSATKFYQNKLEQHKTAEFFEAKDMPKEVSNNEFFNNIDNHEKK